MEPQSFGELLRRLRLKADLTQEELAEAATISTRAVSDLERGVNRAARKDTARLLAEALNLTGEAKAGFEATARGRSPGDELTPPGMRSDGRAAASRTLPRDNSSFIGRQAELRQLVDAIEAVSSSRGVARIHAIGGMAGIGKTALAVHAAHQLAPRFTDGQIFLALHGHTPGQQPVDPADALASLLLTVGVAAHQIPSGLEARARLWRDYLVGTRFLLLLDDAAGHDQVLPLLPGAPDSVVIITSRRHLTALEDTRTISLDLLAKDEAAELRIRLAARAGLEPADPAIQDIGRLCGYLPLAVGMLGRQLNHHPSWAPADLAADLASARDRLALMQTENLSVTAAFNLSYQDLEADQKRLFRRLGVHPGADIDAYAAAALDGTTLAAARRGLAGLYDQYLLAEPAYGRFRLHDLIREHARSLAADDPVADSHAAFGRLMDYYLHVALRAGEHLARRTPPVVHGLTVPAPLHAPDLPDRDDAIAWMDAERLNLHAVADFAASHDRATHGMALASAMHGYLRSRGHWDQASALHHAAVEVARHRDDRFAEVGALTDLGTVQQATGDYAAAAVSLTQATDLSRSLGDQLGEANALSRLGVVQYLLTDYLTAAASLSRALELHRAVGDQLGEANALTDLGVVQYITGDYPAAIASRYRALVLYRGLGYQLGEASALTDLGVVQRVIGEYRAAAANHRRALEIYRGLGYSIGEANALNNLGVVQRATADYAAAEASLSRAVALTRSLGYRLGEANALNNLGAVQRLSGNCDAARASIGEALQMADDLGNRLGQATALINLGALELLLGNLEAAADMLMRALEVSGLLHFRQGEAEALNALGELSTARGEPAKACAYHERALAVASEIGTPLEEARALQGIGRAYLDEGKPERAAEPLRRALSIFQRLGSPGARAVQAMLRDHAD